MDSNITYNLCCIMIISFPVILPPQMHWLSVLQITTAITDSSFPIYVNTKTEKKRQGRKYLK